MDNESIAETLHQIADLMELQGANAFRTRAYRNGARVILTMQGPAKDKIINGEIGKIRGIGKSLLSKLQELVITGNISYLEELKTKLPTGLFEMQKLPGMGPKRIKALYQTLGISSLKELEIACKQGKIANLPRFGNKLQAQILDEIEHLGETAVRRPREEVLPTALTIGEHFLKLPFVEKAKIAGSLRRGKATVKDIDLLVSSQKPEQVMATARGYPSQKVIASGKTKTSIRLNGGLQVGKGNLVICWDSGSGGRRQLDPKYKAQRYPEATELDEDKQSLTGSQETGIMGAWHNVRLVKAMVNAFGLMFAYTEGYEADDTIGSLAKVLEKKLTGKIYLHSSDQDFYQLASSQIGILHPEKKVRGKKYPERLIHRKTILAQYGLEPAKLPWLKAFTGDVSDNIPKIPIRLTQKFKQQLREAVKTADDFEDIFRASFDSNYSKAIEEFKLRAYINLQLLTINSKLQPHVQRSKPNPQFLEKLCQEFDIKELKFKL